MEIIQIVGIGLTATFLIMVIRGKSPEIAFLLSLFVGVSIFIAIIDQIDIIIRMLEEVALRAKVPQEFLVTVLKIVGISYIAEFGSQVIRDAGESALAAKVEFAGKILIVVLAIPILKAVVEQIVTIMGG